MLHCHVHHTDAFDNALFGGGMKHLWEDKHTMQARVETTMFSLQICHWCSLVLKALLLKLHMIWVILCWMRQRVAHTFDVSDVCSASSSHQPSKRQRTAEPLIHNFEDFASDIHGQLWQRHRSNPENALDRCTIRTWFIHHRSHPQCRLSREIFIEGNYKEWHQQLLELWQDQLHPLDPCEAHVVYPPAHDLQNRGLFADVILTQGPIETQNLQGILATFCSVMQPWHVAFSTDKAVSGKSIFSLVRDDIGTKANACDIVSCRTHFIDAEMPIHQLWQAQGFEVTWQSEVSPELASADTTDDTSLMQQPMPSVTALLDESEVDVQPFWIQLLSVQWQAVARRSAECDCPSAHVETWFLHGLHHRRCEHPRTVRLFADVDRWAEAIERAWEDLLIPGQEIIFWVVHPAPPDMIHPTAAHLIVMQDPPDHMICALFSLYDGIATPHMPSRAAQFTHQTVLCDDILSATGVLGDCAAGMYRDLCTCWFRTTQLVLDGSLMRGHNGMHLIALIANEFKPVLTKGSSHSSATRALDAVDHLDLLQIHAAISDAPIDDVIAEDEAQSNETNKTIDFQPVLSIEQEILQMPLPSLVTWDPVDMADLPWDPSTLPSWKGEFLHSLQFYTDGSKSRDTPIGAAVFATGSSAVGTVYVGALVQQLQGEHAYIGELGAMIWAAIWSLQLLHGFECTFAATPHVEFYFDCTSAGYQAAGWYQGEAHPEWKVTIRSLMQAVQSKCGFQNVWYQHLYAHTGWLENEVADRLAKYASRLSVGFQQVPWLHWIQSPPRVDLQWLWLLSDLRAQSPHLPLLRGSQLVVPLHLDKPINNDSGHQFTPPPSSVDRPHAQFRLVLATANVLSLQESQGHNARIIGARQLALMQQFSEAGCTIVAVQETRHQRVSQNNDLFHVFGCPATKQGTSGIQIWISKSPEACPDAIAFKYSDVKVVHATPDALVLKIRHPSCRFVAVAVHAPHAQCQEKTVRTFWKDITSVLHSRCQGWNIFMLGDTNGHVGSEVSAAVGCHHSARENLPGQCFHEWMLQHGLCAPSTFAAHQCGPSGTYVSIRGAHAHRLDYICIPQQLCTDGVTTWIPESIDLTLQRPDHLPVMLTVPIPVAPTSSKQSRKSHRLDAGHISTWLQTNQGHFALRDALQFPAWTMSVHDQAIDLAAQTRTAMPSFTGRHMQSFRKRHLQHQTQLLIRQKQTLYQQIKALGQGARHGLLSGVFHAWKICVQQNDIPWPGGDTWKRNHDLLSATVIAQYDQILPLARQAIRHDDSCFLTSLAEEAGQTYSVEGLQGLWRKIRVLLPRQRSKRDRQKYDLGQGLLNHYCELEAGNPTNWSALWDQIHQAPSMNTAQVDVTLDELPTLCEIERFCVKQKSRRSPGPDQLPGEICKYGSDAIAPFLHNLIMKCLLTGQEPLAYKGGLLCSIHKGRGSQTDPAAYRGIMMSDVFAKVMHGWARSRLVPTFEIKAHPGQLGGRPCQQTSMAIHWLRLHTWCGRDKHLSTATLFVDVRAAFHHMLREFVFGSPNPLTKQQLSRIFDARTHDLDELAASLHAACENPDEAIPPALRALLTDMHHRTWFYLLDADEHSQYVATSRGTRPGSPLADIGFNMLMSRVMHQISAELESVSGYREGLQAAGTDFHPVAWMDDLAIPLVACHSALLAPMIQQVLALIHTVFQKAGLTLNLDKGKTEAVIMHRGHQADEHRLALFDNVDHPCLVASSETHVLTLRIAPSFKHLGAKYTMDADLEPEVNARLGAARTAFHELKRPVFTNRRIEAKGRVQLLHSLVFSRLLYGCSVWTDVTPSLLRKVESQLMRMYRSIYDIGFWQPQHVTDAALRAFHEIPTFRVLWAKLRLQYLKTVACHSMPGYKDALLAELPRGRGWLCEVQADLHWMSTHVELPFPVPSANPDSWHAVWESIASHKQWPRLVNKAFWRHIKGESVAWQTEHLHDLILQDLETQGLQPMPTSANLDQFTQQHCCQTCAQSFDTHQKLVIHRLRRHGIESDERAYIQGTVCPGCLYDYWTTRRLQQHLKARSNGCYDRIHETRPPEPTVHISLPPHLAGVKRLKARRLHHGPLRPTREQRLKRELAAELAKCEAHGEATGAWLQPCLFPDRYDAMCAYFQTCLDDTTSPLESLHDCLLACPPTQYAHEAELACALDAWCQDVTESAAISGQVRLQLLALRVDLDIERTRQWKQSLLSRIDSLQDATGVEPQTDSVRQSRPRDRLHSISDAMQWSADREANRRNHQWVFQALDRGPFQRPQRLIIHLYSGRRRKGDFHFWCETLLAATTHNITVLSIDTAISDQMDVLAGSFWPWLLSACQTGYVVGLLLGPPCETWSSARFHSLADGKGPRPVRSRSQPWGVSCLTCPELQQIRTGTTLLLRGLWLACWVGYCGGAVVLEHPARPNNQTYPTIWELALIRILLDKVPWFASIDIEQWLLGGTGVKPTTLMYAHCDLPAWIRANECHHLTRPSEGLIGRDSTGAFRTAKAKEYPMLMNRALAQAMISNQSVFGPSDNDGPAPDWWNFVQEMSTACASSENGVMKPDYQRKRWCATNLLFNGWKVEKVICIILNCLCLAIASCTMLHWNHWCKRKTEALSIQNWCRRCGQALHPSRSASHDWINREAHWQNEIWKFNSKTEVLQTWHGNIV